MKSANEFDWSQIRDKPAPAAADAAMSTPPPELTGKQMLKALEVGAVGGGILGILTAFFSDTPFLAAVAVGAIIGAVVWLALTAAVESTRKSRSMFVGFLRFAYGAAAVLYAVAFVVLMGMLIYVKASIADKRPVETYVPPADIR